jgi:hypothetical protein
LFGPVPSSLQMTDELGIRRDLYFALRFIVAQARRAGAYELLDRLNQLKRLPRSL